MVTIRLSDSVGRGTYRAVDSRGAAKNLKGAASEGYVLARKMSRMNDDSMNDSPRKDDSMSSRSLLLQPLSADLWLDFSQDEYPTSVSGWSDSTCRMDDEGTHFGFVSQGPARLRVTQGEFLLQSGMYFAVPGSLEVDGAGAGLIMTRLGYRGFFQIGGPIERLGRLRYIDGCTDSLLIPPVMLGDPCLNLLYIPPGVTQTAHTHPSLRAGMIAAGTGVCWTPEAEYPLEPGLVFLIHANQLHRFCTEDDSLTVIAWHPDSDFGPTHERHPMVNRTIVAGQSIKGSYR